MDKNYLNKKQKNKQPDIKTYESEFWQLQSTYPTIFENGKRTSKTFKNIALLVFSISSLNKKLKTSSLFLASILLSAQDDFMDDINVPLKEKVGYIKKVNSLINGEKNVPETINDSSAKKRVKELLILWNNLYESLKKECDDYSLFVPWRETAKILNQAMLEEKKLSAKTTSFKNYFYISSRSIGASFVLITYLISNNTPPKILSKIKNSLKYLDKTVRLANDVATHGREVKIDAISLLNKENNYQKRIKKMVNNNLLKLKKELLNSEFEEEKKAKKIILDTSNLMVRFYRRGLL